LRGRAKGAVLAVVVRHIAPYCGRRNRGMELLDAILESSIYQWVSENVVDNWEIQQWKRSEDQIDLAFVR
jgi:hypothetical protein